MAQEVEGSECFVRHGLFLVVVVRAEFTEVGTRELHEQVDRDQVSALDASVVVVHGGVGSRWLAWQVGGGRRAQLSPTPAVS